VLSIRGSPLAFSVVLIPRIAGFISDMDSYINKTLGDFEIIREIGRGGMGVVYEAEQRSLKRRVALKILPPAVALDREAVERFEREAVNAAKLHHPNVVPVYSVGSELGNHYFAMEYVEGKSVSQIIAEVRRLRKSSGLKTHSGILSREREDSFLDVLLPAAKPEMDGGTPPTMPNLADKTRDDNAQETTDLAADSNQSGLADTERFSSSGKPERDRGSASRMSGTGSRAQHGTGNRAAGARGLRWWRAIANLMASVADALHYAHEEGVIHRDVKPSNILLSGSGRPLVLDFGLSLDLADMQITATGAFLGTPLYMSPEQALGRVTIDHRTDIYSLGISLYELATLSVPFEGEREEIIKQIVFKDPPLPRRVYRAVPTDLQTIICKAIEKDPDRRYQTAGEFADDLRRFTQGNPIHARPASLLGLFWRQAMRQKKRVAIIATIVASLAMGLGGVALYQLKEHELADIRGERQLDQQTLLEREREIALLEQQESREKLLAELKHDDPDKRSKAAKALGEMEDRLGRAGLEAAADDTDAAVREQVILALGRIGDHRSLNVVAKALNDSNSKVRVAAAVALTHLEQPAALPDLIATLRKTSPSVADKKSFQAAIRALAGKAHTREVVELWKEGLVDRQTLLAVVDSSAVPEVAKWVVQGTDAQRLAACGLLEELGDGRAGEALLNGLENNASDEVQGACARALAKIAAPEHVAGMVREMGRAPRSAVWDPLDLALAAVPDEALRAINNELEAADQRSLIMLCKPVQRMSGRPAVECLLKMLEIDGQSGTRSYLSYAAVRGLSNMHDVSVLPKLIELAESPERLIRQQVALALGNFMDPQVTDVLMAATDDPEVDVQVNAVASLGYQRHRPALKKLRELSRHPSAQVRSSVVRTLGRMHEADELLPLLKDQDPSVRANAALALGVLRHEPAVVPLITALEDSSPLVRQRAATALGRAAHPVAVAPLIEALRDSDEGVVREAAGALALTGDHAAIRPLVQAAYRTADAEKTGEAVVEALGRFRLAALPPVLEDLSNVDSANRKQAVQLLGRLGHRAAAPALRPRTRDKASEVRAAAAEALGQLADAASAADILALLKDPLRTVRYSALTALSQLPLAEAPQEVAEIALDSADPLNYRATYVFGKLQDPATLPALLELAKHDDARVRRQAILGLACLGQGEVVEMIRRELASANRGVRVQFARSLAVVKTEAAVELLAQIAEDDQPFVVQEALRALGTLRSDTAYQKIVASLKHSRVEIRENAAAMLARQPEGRGAPDLIAALQDSAPDVLEAVESALRILSDPDVPALEAELIQNLTDSDANVRAVSATRLRAYRSPQVQEALIAALDDAFYLVRARAAESLGYLNAAAAVPRLRTMTADADATIRSAAVAALGRLRDEPSLDLLLKALQDPAFDVREQAALGIACLRPSGKAEAVSALINASSDAYPQVRSQAAFALGEIGGLSAITALEDLIREPDPSVARAAAEALIEATSGQVPPVLLDLIDSAPPDFAVSLLARANRLENSDLMPRLEKLLSEESSLRAAAVSALAWVHRRQGTELPPALSAAVDEQLHILRRQLTLAPDHAATLNELAWLQAATQRDLDEALHASRQAAYLDPNARYLDTLAEVYRVRGELAEAIAVLKRPEMLDGKTVSPNHIRRRIEQLEQRQALVAHEFRD
jgi:HEAT repeat protein